jgi:hypothetical protein
MGVRCDECEQFTLALRSHCGIRSASKNLAARFYQNDKRFALFVSGELFQRIATFASGSE